MNLMMMLVAAAQEVTPEVTQELPTEFSSGRDLTIIVMVAVISFVVFGVLAIAVNLIDKNADRREHHRRAS